MDTTQLKMIEEIVKTPAAQEVMNALKKALATDMRNNAPFVVEAMKVLARLTDTSDDLLSTVGMVDRYAVAAVSGSILQVLKKIQKEG